MNLFGDVVGQCGHVFKFLWLVRILMFLYICLVVCHILFCLCDLACNIFSLISHILAPDHITF
jgi:hypothetical protein